MQRKEHLTPEGMEKLVALKASLNLGLSDELKAAFPDIVPSPRPQGHSIKIPSPYWMSGFVEGESIFYIKIVMRSSKETVSFRFLIGQLIRDVELLKSLINYMGCGIIRILPKLPVCEYTVTSIDDIKCKIIPFLDKYPLQGNKLLDYLDFKKAVLLKPDKRVSLTKEKLEEIRQLKTGMNRGRVWSSENSKKNNTKL
jgi:hypothetical protein